MSRIDSAQQFNAVRKYLLDHFPGSYVGFRKDSESRDLRFLLDFEGTPRIIVFTPEFLDEHTAEAIPTCLDRKRLDIQIWDSRALYVIVRREGIDQALAFPKSI